MTNGWEQRPGKFKLENRGFFVLFFGEGDQPLEHMTRGTSHSPSLGTFKLGCALAKCKLLASLPTQLQGI